MDDYFDKWSVQARKGALEVIILGALKDEARYAFELIGTIRQRAALEMPEGTIYPLLLRLAKDGMIAADWREGEGGGAPRKYYALTDSGGAMLRKMAAGWRQLSAAVEAMIGGVK